MGIAAMRALEKLATNIEVQLAAAGLARIGTAFFGEMPHRH
jgi:hypothetical protein